MKEPIPNIELELSDVVDIKTMSEKELKLVPFDKRKWLCGVKGCTRHTTVKDYGLSPEYYWRGLWVNISTEVFLCVNHFKQYKDAGKDSSIFELKDKNDIKIELEKL